MRSKLTIAMAALATLGGFAVGTAKASLILYEGFSGAGYTSGANVTGLNGGSGAFTAAWNTINNASAGSQTISASTLTYTAGGKTLVTSGNASQDTNSGKALGNIRTYSATITDGTVIWMSALLNTSATSSNAVIFASSSADPSASSGGAGINVTGGATGQTVGAQIGGTSTSTGGLALTSGTTNFLVAKLTFSSTAGQDKVEVWANPDLTTGPTSGVNSVSILGDILTGNQLGTRGGSAWTGTEDEIRLGTTFADVAPIPEPAALASIAMASGLLMIRRRRRD